jgi:hypothetical protein
VAVKGANDVKWVKLDKSIDCNLAFDHNFILNGSIERLRNKVLYTSLPIYLMKSKFTLGELQKVYEIILGKKMDHKSFRRRILKADILEEIDEMQYGKKRPAQLYKAKKTDDAYFFTRNIGG